MGNLSLIMVMAFLVGYTYVGSRLRSTQESVSDSTSVMVNAVQLKLLTASGINRALNQLTLHSDSLGGITGSIRNGTFTVAITRISGSQLRVVSIAAIGAQRDTAQVTLQFPSFSRFAYITDNDGSNIRFITGDTLRGPVHTNSYFTMDGRPAFMNSVSSHQSYGSTGYNPASSGTNPYFAQTPNWGAPDMSLPTNTDSLRAAAIAGGRVFNTATLYLQFLADGTYQVRTSSTGAWTAATRPTNGIIFVGPNTGTSTGYTVNVSGVVKGQYTLAVQGNMNITGDITYNTDPRVNPASTDLLGLVTRLNCAVTNSVANTDRTIMAHILCMNESSTSNTVNFYNSTYTSIKSNYLNIYGGLAQKKRGAVGQGSGTSRTGYLKNYMYDNRLQDISPPGYPLTTVLQQVWYWE